MPQTFDAGAIPSPTTASQVVVGAAMTAQLQQTLLAQLARYTRGWRATFFSRAEQNSAEYTRAALERDTALIPSAQALLDDLDRTYASRFALSAVSSLLVTGAFWYYRRTKRSR